MIRHYSGDSHVNIGTGVEVTISQLAHMIAQVIGWEGEFRFDVSKPDGIPRKVMDVSTINAMGWQAHVSLVMLAFAMMATIRHRANAATPPKTTLWMTRSKRR